MSTGNAGRGKGLPEKESECGAADSIRLLALRTQPSLGAAGGRGAEGMVESTPTREEE